MIMKNACSPTCAAKISEQMAGMIHLLMQNTGNEDIVIPDGVKNGVALKFSPDHTGNGQIFPSGVWHARQRVKKRLHGFSIMLRLNFTKTQQRVIVNA